MKAGVRQLAYVQTIARALDLTPAELVTLCRWRYDGARLDELTREQVNDLTAFLQRQGGYQCQSSDS